MIQEKAGGRYIVHEPSLGAVIAEERRIARKARKEQAQAESASRLALRKFSWETR